MLHIPEKYIRYPYRHSRHSHTHTFIHTMTVCKHASTQKKKIVWETWLSANLIHVICMSECVCVQLYEKFDLIHLILYVYTHNHIDMDEKFNGEMVDHHP